MITVRADSLVMISIEAGAASEAGYQATLILGFGTDLAEVGYLGTAAVHQDTAIRNPSVGRTLARAVGFIVVEWLVSWPARSID
jgi:hypothetical protein